MKKNKKRNYQLEEQLQNSPVEPTFPDYEDSILNLSCSMLKHFGVKPLHDTIPQVDEILSRGYKHVVVILLDGLGMNVLEKHLTRFDFLRRNLLTDYSSVFPPTTTAATTSFLSGQSPIEHGWLGWDVYFEQEDKTVTCFYNRLQGTDEKAAEYNVPERYLPYKNIAQQINEAGQAKANIVYPFKEDGNGLKNISQWLKEIKNSVKTDDKTFTYAYWNEPDGTLHKNGNRSSTVHEIVQDLNSYLLDLCEDLKETVVFITADHGHTNIQNVTLTETYPELAAMLERQISIESRAISFYVKPECREDFPALFNKHFGGDYKLYTKQEVLDMKLFGPGEPNPNLTGIGDFIAAATGSKTIVWDKNSKMSRSQHAGLTKEEMRIPLIWYENKPKKTGYFVYYAIIFLLILFLGICIL